VVIASGVEQAIKSCDGDLDPLCKEIIQIVLKNPLGRVNIHFMQYLLICCRAPYPSIPSPPSPFLLSSPPFLLPSSPLHKHQAGQSEEHHSGMVQTSLDIMTNFETAPQWSISVLVVCHKYCDWFVKCHIVHETWGSEQYLACSASASSCPVMPQMKMSTYNVKDKSVTCSIWHASVVHTMHLTLLLR